MKKRQSGVSVAVVGGANRDQSTVLTLKMNMVKGLSLCARHRAPNIVSTR